MGSEPSALHRLIKHAIARELIAQILGQPVETIHAGVGLIGRELIAAFGRLTHSATNVNTVNRSKSKSETSVFVTRQHPGRTSGEHKCRLKVVCATTTVALLSTIPSIGSVAIAARANPDCNATKSLIHRLSLHILSVPVTGRAQRRQLDASKALCLIMIEFLVNLN